MDSILDVAGLQRRFGDHQVIRSLSVVADLGERVALWGPNGSGKTTLLRCISGAVEPTGGSITIGGHAAGTRQARGLLGASFSAERSFYVRLSGHDNLLFFARLRGGGHRQTAREVGALEAELELEEIARERVDRCSTGMVQQLGLARALLRRPPLLLLDEPTRSLDAEARTRLWGHSIGGVKTPRS